MGVFFLVAGGTRSFESQEVQVIRTYVHLGLRPFLGVALQAVQRSVLALEFVTGQVMVEGF